MSDSNVTKQGDGPFERLPRGRHKLSREEVESDQRERIMRAMSESVGEIGYVKTTVAHVLKRAGVSRDTFYSQFSDKHDCFMASFERAADEMVNRMQAAVEQVNETGGSAEERVSMVLASFLGLVAEEPDIARTYYVEVYAAGQDAIEHRVEIQLRTVELMQGMLDIKPEDRFAVQATMAAIGAIITQVVSLGQAENAVFLQKDLLKFILAALRGIDPDLV
jgi:AcrR family transcriptional regulator